MKRILGLLVLAAGVLLAQPQTAPAAFASVPRKAVTKRNPLATDPDAPAAGRKLFAQHCAACHGPAAEGSRKGPPLHAAEIQNATPGRIFWIITNGVVRRGMPAWSKLPEPQRWQIVSYLTSFNASIESQP